MPPAFRSSIHRCSPLVASLLLALGACSSAEQTDSVLAEGPIGELQSELGSSSARGTACDPSTTAGAGWLNTFIPDSTGVFTMVFQASPSSSPIDAVIGLSTGAARRFSDLGPIVRFAPSGYIDARNGGSYTGAFPYHSGDGPYEFQLRVDLAAHNYIAWVRRLDAPYQLEILGQDLAFRTEQSGATRLDNLARFVDSAAGSLQTCAFGYASPTACTQSGARAWQSRAFPARTGQVRLEFYAWVNTWSIDAVIGPSNGVPTAFKSLAAAVRFRPDGMIDVRNGGVYAADTAFGYRAGSYYQFVMDIDMAQAKYSVKVAPYGQAFVSLAQNYAFRTEQAGARRLDHLGQYVDAPSGFVDVCELTVVY